MIARIHRPEHRIGRTLAALAACIACAIIAAAMPVHAQWLSVQPDGLNIPMNAITFPTTSTGYGVGANGAGAVIVRTNDAAASWDGQVAQGALFFDARFFSTDTGIIVGYDNTCQCGLIMKTTDGGGHWLSGTVATSFGLYSLSFPGQDTGYACGYDGTILKTTDRGESWRRVKTGTTDVFRRIFMVDEEMGYALAGLGRTYSQPGQIYKTTDHGEHWNRIQDFSGSKVFADVWFTSPDVGYVVGWDSAEAVYRTRDGGTTWTRIYTGSSEDVLQTVVFVDARTGYVAGTGGRILRTTNAGGSWTVETSPTHETLSDIAVTPSAMYAVGLEGAIIKRDGAPATVAADRTTADRTISVTPLPFDETATISLANIAEGTPYEFTMADVAGRVVLRTSGRYSQGGFSIHRNGLAAGVYVYTVATPEHVPRSGRLMVR